MTPEEIQAMENSAKIRRFIGAIGWQFAVFAVVVYATVQANTIANYMLDGYTWILAISFISYFIIAAQNSEKLAGRDLTKLKAATTPSMAVLRYIGLFFTVIEIPILFTHGYLYLALFWGLTELLQFISVRNIAKAVALQEGSVTLLSKAAMTKSPDFSKDLEPVLKEYNKNLDELDKLIELSMEDNNIEAAEELRNSRNELIVDIEKVITKAALETLKKD